MTLGQDFWNKYGFVNNPFDTTALTLYSDALFPISKAYVGRGQDSREFQLMTNIFSGSGGCRAIVEGEVGVGKTTFVNHHRYIWENGSQDRLFTPYGEITFSLRWTRVEFLQEILSHIVTKLYLLYGQTLPVNNGLYQELLVLNKVFVEENYQWQVDVFGVGGGVNRERQIFIPKISEAKLDNYYRETVRTLLRLDYSGVILHFDNMELLQQKELAQTQQVFDEIRDLLQVPNVYYIFVGKTGFFNRIISSLERVRSIFFSWPVHLRPLSIDEVLKVIELRYQLLSSHGARYIPPVEEDLISFLYTLYQGKIRFIMAAIHGILANFPLPYPQTLSTKRAKELLKSLTIEKIRYALTQRELEVLLEMVPKEEFTNTDMANSLGLQRQNVSKYIQKLCQTGYVAFARKEGRNSFYMVTDEIKYLRNLLEENFSPPESLPDVPNSPAIALNMRQRQCLAQGSCNSTFTTKQYAETFSISPPTALRDLNELVQEGYLRKFGRKKGVYFTIVEQP